VLSGEIITIGDKTHSGPPPKSLADILAEELDGKLGDEHTQELPVAEKTGALESRFTSASIGSSRRALHSASQAAAFVAQRSGLGFCKASRAAGCSTNFTIFPPFGRRIHRQLAERMD